MKRRLLLIATFVLGGLAYLALHADKKNGNEVKVKNVGVQDFKPEVTTVQTQAVIAKKVQQNQDQAQNILPFEKLKQFKLIQAKVFKSDTETEILKNFVSDPVVIRDLTQYLLSPAQIKQSNFRENQNAAIDLILESLKSSNPQSAVEAILEVAKDSQVENNLIESSVRQSLAGTKAELLYQGSALRPDLFTSVEALLPGPVSQKIWKNIQHKQFENASESESEKKSRTFEPAS